MGGVGWDADDPLGWRLSVSKAPFAFLSSEPPGTGGISLLLEFLVLIIIMMIIVMKVTLRLAWQTLGGGEESGSSSSWNGRGPWGQPALLTNCEREARPPSPPCVLPPAIAGRPAHAGRARDGAMPWFTQWTSCLCAHSQW